MDKWKGDWMNRLMFLFTSLIIYLWPLFSELAEREGRPLAL